MRSASPRPALVETARVACAATWLSAPGDDWIASAAPSTGSASARAARRQQGAAMQVERRTEHRVGRAEQSPRGLRGAPGAGDRLGGVALRQPHFGEADQPPGGPLVLRARSCLPRSRACAAPGPRPRRSGRARAAPRPGATSSGRCRGCRRRAHCCCTASARRSSGSAAAGVALLREHFAQSVVSAQGGLRRLGACACARAPAARVG